MHPAKVISFGDSYQKTLVELFLKIHSINRKIPSNPDAN
jgi:hypothetical protein